jgi:hypothetical protein
MRDQSYHGGRGGFIAGLALAIALFMPACVAGEVADEAEAEGPVASAGAGDTQAKAAEPLGSEEQARVDVSAAGEEQIEGATTGDPCAGPPRTEHVDVTFRRCRKVHRPMTEVLSDPPPSPWMR